LRKIFDRPIPVNFPKLAASSCRNGGAADAAQLTLKTKIYSRNHLYLFWAACAAEGCAFHSYLLPATTKDERPDKIFGAVCVYFFHKGAPARNRTLMRLCTFAWHAVDYIHVHLWHIRRDGYLPHHFNPHCKTTSASAPLLLLLKLHTNSIK